MQPTLTFWPKNFWPKTIFFLSGIIIGSLFLLSFFYVFFERNYEGRIFPGVKVAGVDFSGKESQEVEEFFGQKNRAFGELKFTFIFEDKIATLSAQDFEWGFDAKMAAHQAYSLGRGGDFFARNYQRLILAKQGLDLPPVFAFNDAKLTEFLRGLAQKIDIEPQEALFSFGGGRVVAFQLSKNGRALDIEETKKEVARSFGILNSFDLAISRPVGQEKLPETVTINLPVKKVKAKANIEEINNLGIRELVGRGTSRFAGSIPNRVHNIQLAASRLNGVLVAPGEEFSFNKALGDVSRFTGYKEAYIIKDGRTVLGDGGGVCQVSTTFFRALLNAGLPILERHAHSYRVSYYEQDSSVGFDASVYAPSWDLKFKNNLGSHILIQSYVDTANMTLTFEFYGTRDGRVANLSPAVIKNQVAPPEDQYLDDPNLPKGVVKQIDWKAWGAEVAFSRTVTRGGEALISETFNSRYQPWQAVFLRGTRE